MSTARATIFKNLGLISAASGEEIYIITHNANPSTLPGFDAPEGSVLIYPNGIDSGLYFKIGPLNTDWVDVANITTSGAYVRTTPTLNNGNTTDGLVFQNASEALNAILYPNEVLKFNSFTTPLFRLSVGQNLVDPNFTFTTNNITDIKFTDPSFLEIRDVDSNDLLVSVDMTLEGPNLSLYTTTGRILPTVYSYTGITTATTKKVRVTLRRANESIASAEIDLIWNQDIKFGKSINTSLSPLGISGLSSTKIENTRFNNYGYSISGSPEYLWLAIPESLLSDITLANRNNIAFYNFKDDFGITIPMIYIGEPDITNAFGETFKVRTFRSFYPTSASVSLNLI